MALYPEEFSSVATESAAVNDRDIPFSQRNGQLVPEDAAGQRAPGLLSVAVRFTIVTTILLGIGYPLAVTSVAQLTMRNKADGQLITRDGHIIGPKLIGQRFTRSLTA